MWPDPKSAKSASVKLQKGKLAGIKVVFSEHYATGKLGFHGGLTPLAAPAAFAALGAGAG